LINNKFELPVVSIITPSFNQGEYIEDTIKSVLSQDYPNIEYIIIDGGSSDNTKNIISKYSGLISHWESGNDEGQTDAIIKGIKRSKGKYITWLCSDDILEPSMITISVAVLESNPKIVMTFGDRIRYDNKSNIIGYHRYCDFRPFLLKWGFAIPQETTLFRRDAYMSAGELDKSLHMAMDFDLFCKLSRTGRIVHIPAFLGRFRSHANNKSTIFDKEVSETGFKAGAPKELGEVYRRHFNRILPARKWKYIPVLIEFLGFFDRRKKSYKVCRQKVSLIRSGQLVI
jgi:glycosyltransferase involved in cell wall biosynthesis